MGLCERRGDLDLEREIDERGYRLYGLTKEEIVIVVAR